jgi:hypothetical protein
LLPESSDGGTNAKIALRESSRKEESSSSGSQNNRPVLAIIEGFFLVVIAAVSTQIGAVCYDRTHFGLPNILSAQPTLGVWLSKRRTSPSVADSGDRRVSAAAKVLEMITVGAGNPAVGLTIQKL